MGTETVSEKILTGNLLFTGCCVVYLIWWCVAFRPGASAPMSIKSLLFFATFFLGAAGMTMIARGCLASEGVHFGGIIAAGIAVYIILLFGTQALFHRQVTTELLLIVFWTVMEVCAVFVLSAEGIFLGRSFAVICMVILVAALVGIICYLKYYELPPMPAFYDGMVPLILFALVMVGISVCQVRVG